VNSYCSPALRSRRVGIMQVAFVRDGVKCLENRHLDNKIKLAVRFLKKATIRTLCL